MDKPDYLQDNSIILCIYQGTNTINVEIDKLLQMKMNDEDHQLQMLSFTQYTQSVSLGKCSTIVSSRFTRLFFNILRRSNSRPPSALGPTCVDSYVVCLAYVVRHLSLIRSVQNKSGKQLYSNTLLWSSRFNPLIS